MCKTGMDAVRDIMPMAELARQLGITRGAVAQWDRVPGERLFEVSRITGLEPKDIRPDMFAPAPERQSA